MATIQKRGISLLLVLVLMLGMIPSVSAAEISTEPSTEPAETTIPVTEETQAAETSPPETTQPEETLPPETTQPEETTPTETAPSETDPTEETEPVEEPSTELEEDMGINEIATFSIANCPSATWATIWVNTDEYSSIAGKTNLFIYYEFPAGTAKNRNNVGLKAIKVDGAWQAAYCLEPGIAEGSKYNTEEMTKDEFLSSSVVPNTLSIAQLEAMCIAALYGQHSLPQSSNYEDLSNMVATQIIIWEIAIGWRDCYPPYAQTNDAFIRRFKHGYGVGPEATSSYITIGGRLQTVIDCYNEISANMAAHDESILSFASRSSSRAPTIELTPDGTGKYTATVTDTNGVLSDFSFTNTSKLKFTKNGNKLTIAASEQVKDILVAPTKQMADANNHIYFVWHNGSYQVMLATPTEPSYDPIPAYFYVTTPELKSSLDLTKTTEDGKNLSNWSFGIYSDSGCSNLISGPHTTDVNGKISVGDLTAGTVYVKELGHKDNSINSLYTCASTNPQKVVLVAGETASVSFHNKLNTGSVKLVKETSCGEHLSGWQIGLYTDAACTKAVSGSPFTTGEDGSITVSDLSVGTLYVKEIPVDDPYWICDPEVKTITIEAGKTATVSFLNTHYGNIRITKNAVNGSTEGWNFQILDAERNAIGTVKSGADGYAYSDMLLPGQYFIREIHDRDDTYWEYDAVVEKEVTVTAGSQVEVTYTNTQYGKIQIQKSMPDGGSLDGWQFSITDTSGREIEGSPFTTNASGLILTGKLEPGEYTVKEIIPEGSFYYCTSDNPQTITVKAGETAQASFTNAMRYGQITIEKVDSPGEPLAGAKFMLQWSEDGSLWWPIEYDSCDIHHLFCVLPRTGEEQYLRYCPLCTVEDRERYGEAYWHRKHQIRNMSICTRHRCRLETTDIPAKSEQNYIFYPAENTIPDRVAAIVSDPLLIRFAAYIEAVFDAPLQFEKEVPVSSILYRGMSRTKYLKPSGRSRYTKMLADDMKVFYERLGVCSIATMNQIQRVLLGSRFDFSVVCQIAFFLGMDAEELTSVSLTVEQMARLNAVESNLWLSTEVQRIMYFPVVTSSAFRLVSSALISSRRASASALASSAKASHSCIFAILLSRSIVLIMYTSYNLRRDLSALSPSSLSCWRFRLATPSQVYAAEYVGAFGL